MTLAICLITAQPFPAHRPTTDDNSLIGRCPVPLHQKSKDVVFTH